MTHDVKAIATRFRAYQLGEPGSSFSYFADNHFTLIEGRLTDRIYRSLAEELKICRKTSIDTLHITSWDKDHCNLSELKRLLEYLQPRKIEYPGYAHDSDNYENCLAEISDYKKAQQRLGRAVVAQRIDPKYINSLEKAEQLGYKNIFFHPKETFKNSNDNSTVKLFRKGMFNVASLGDVEHPNIGSLMRRSRSFKSEVDILILAHHGSANEINTKTFFETVRPSVAVCSADYDNQYGHPHSDVREALYEARIPVYTTKTGDVLIESIPNHRKEYAVTNFKANSSEVSSRRVFTSKKFNLMRMNIDTIRNRIKPGFKGLR